MAVNPEATGRSPKICAKFGLPDGGELISLLPDEQAALLKLLSSVGEDVSKTKPLLSSAYQIVSAAAQRTEIATPARENWRCAASRGSRSQSELRSAPLRRNSCMLVSSAWGSSSPP